MRTSQAKRAAGVTLAAVLLQAVMLIAFAWPAANTEPRDVPIAVAGPEAQVNQISGRLAAETPGEFEVTKVADEAAARTALTDRDAYGAIVITPQGPTVLTASAASPVVAQRLNGLAAQYSGMPAARVQDVVATDSDDPRGTGFSALALPLVMAGIGSGVLLIFVVPVLRLRVAALAGMAVLGGLVTMALAQGWLSLLGGSYLEASAAAGLALFVVAGTVVGLEALIGRPGIGLSAMTFLLLGNPLSGATSAPEMLPQPWGEVGQLLPPGAAMSLLRSIAFFDGAGAAKPLTVMLSWAAGVIVVLSVAGWRKRTSPSAAEALTASEQETAMVS